MKRTLSLCATLIAAALIAAGCGGGPDIASVESCLKDLKLNVERSEKGDKDVEDGVSGLSGAEDKELTIALAAIAKDESKVKEFQDRNKELTSGLSGQQSKDFQFDSGSDGNYVWVVAGSKDSKNYGKARDCVQP